MSGKHLKAIAWVDYPADIPKTCEQFLAIFVYIQIVSGKYFKATSSVVYLVSMTNYCEQFLAIFV